MKNLLLITVLVCIAYGQPGLNGKQSSPSQESIRSRIFKNRKRHTPKVYAKTTKKNSATRKISKVGPIVGITEISEEVRAKYNKILVSLNFKNTSIHDVIQGVNGIYSVNIIVQRDVIDSINISLEELGLVDALEAICTSNGWSLSFKKNLFYISLMSEESRNVLQVNRTRMDLDVKNQEIKQFIRDFSIKSKLRILADKRLEGTVTGNWKSQKPLEAFKALMSAHNFKIKRKSGFYIVQPGDDENKTTTRNRRNRSTKGSGKIDVEVTGNKVNLILENSNLQEVLKEIAEQAGLNTIFYGEIKENINARLSNVSINEAFSSLMKGTSYTYLTTEEGTILVGSKEAGSKAGQVLTTYELYRLKHIKSENVSNLLPSTLGKGLLTTIKEQNAVLISGTRVDIELVKNYLDIIDLPTPQILLECIIVELTRGEGSE